MAEYHNVTTNLGDAEIANAIATNTKLNITHIAFGDGNGSVPTPNKARTSLVREVHRQAVTKYERHATNANWIVIETIIPSGVGGFTIREMGIIANGKLISHGSHAPFEKVADPSGVSEYRLRFVQDITDASVVSIILDQSLIYASQAWVEENYIKRTEIVDNLITADPNKPLSANAGKSLQDGKLGKNDNAVSATKLQTARTIGGVSFDGTTNINLPGVNAAGTQSTTGNAATATTATNCSRSIVAGNGLSGGGDLTANRTVTLGTPTKITSSSTNSVTTTSHTHEIDNASTSVAGVVQLNNTLTSTSSTQALTAAQGKVLNDALDVAISDLDVLLYSPIPYSKLIPPNGFLAMMGQDIVQSIHPKLYSIYGAKLPDLRAYTIRGLDHGRGIDIGREILSEQGDAIRNITGDAPGGSDARVPASSYTGAFSLSSKPAGKISTGENWGLLTAKFDASRVVPTANENRVKTIAFLYIVKAG